MSGRSVTRFSRISGLAASAAFLSVTAAGCGTEDRNYDTGSRPPVTKNISVILRNGHAEISPRSIGGGPATVTIANQSGGPVANVRLRSMFGDGGCLSNEAVSGPIPASGTGKVTATLVEGACELVADGVGQARLLVIGERRSAQNKLLLP